MLRLVIPGEPHAQGRGRAFVNKRTGRAFVVDPAKSRDWKATAQEHMLAALRDNGYSVFRAAFPEGPLKLEIVAIWTLARTHWRKTITQRQWKDTKPDPDNVAKAVMDAGNGVLWHDDSQVADLRVRRIRGGQGEAPRVIVGVDVCEWELFKRQDLVELLQDPGYRDEGLARIPIP